MSFAFKFGGDDIENDDEDNDLVQQVGGSNNNDTPLIRPKKHTLQQLLSSLPSRISYNLLPIQGQQNNSDAGLVTIVPRRSVFDIRAQLMAEASEQNENDMLLAGLERGDLTSGVYEGGFKTWECSLDLASLVADLAIDRDFHIIELGAGSAVPSLVALGRSLKQSPSHNVQLTLCDYNEDVLRHATAPNVFLTAEIDLQSDSPDPAQEDLDIDDIGDEEVARCNLHFEDKRVTFDFLSGAWGDDFLHLVQTSSQYPSTRSCSTLILASETIYSPESTKIFTDTLMRLLLLDPNNSKAWVAAKKVYFGVGGSVDDFVEQVRKQGGSVSALLDVKGAGVGRVVLEITAMV